MSDTTVIEHDPNEKPGPAPDQQEPEAPAKVIDEPEEQTPLAVRTALVPVGSQGAAPANLAQQVDFARMMAKATLSLPKHLHNNIGDCLAVLDIASRAGLSPYMMAMKTYEQGGKLCFESQLFHALLDTSGRLKGALRVKYDGEGEARTCTVWGTLKGETEPHELTSPPLGTLRPARNEKGQVKGSPLWVRKPDVQMFYDTSRDWVRLYCPTATLGMYTPEELQEYPDGLNIDSAGKVSPDLHKRLTGGNVDRTEGHQAGHAETELARVATGDPKIERAAPKATHPKPGKRKQGQKPKQAAKTAPKAKAAVEAPKGSKGHPAQTAAKPSSGKETAKSAPASPKMPKSSPEYVAYADKWIAEAKSRDDAWARWEGERELRDDCRVTIPARIALQASITDRFPDQQK